MRINRIFLLLSIGIPALLTCSTPSVPYNPLDDGYEQINRSMIFETPDPLPSARYTTDLLDRGRYFIALLGCGSCHTDGALMGTPDPDRLLAGSNVGIAFSSPFTDANPGVVYPRNLTPDIETGIGAWTMDQIVDMVREGVTDHSQRSLPVMPWPAYAKITEDDAFAIAAYLKSLSPVSHQVPPNVAVGEEAQAPYIHFGVYWKD